MYLRRQLYHIHAGGHHLSNTYNSKVLLILMIIKYNKADGIA